MNKSINELIASAAALGADDENGEQEESAVSPAERLGRALLDEFGPVEGVTEDELVDALLDAWKKRERRRETGAEPFEKSAKRPVPMRTGSNAAAPVDYADMSQKQFSEFKRMLKKASADGKKVRI